MSRRAFTNFLAMDLVDLNPFLVIIMSPFSVASEGGKWALINP